MSERRIVMVFFHSAEEAETFAAERGWATHTVVPSTKEGAGFWLAKGVTEMPAEYHGLRLFPSDFTQKIRVTCGYGRASHSWETTKAEAKVFGHCPEHRQ